MNYFFRFLIIILFIILIYVVYRSEIYWVGSRRYAYLQYYNVTILTIVFLIICTYLEAKIQKYIIIVLLSTIFGFYSFEAKLIFYSKKNLNFENRKIIEVYEDLKKNNSNVAVVTPPRNFIFNNELDLLSLSGISKAKTISCNENGYYGIYQSDRYGFNNPDKEWDSKEIEYLLVGDSFTHGDCVNRPDDISSVLRLYTKKNVLNLGFGGNGPLIEYATLREYLPPNVKNVLWLYFEGNDLYDLENELKNNILKNYFINQQFKQDLKYKQTQIDQILNIYIDRSKIERSEERVLQSHNSKIVEFIKLFNTRGLLFPSPSRLPQPPQPELKIILKSAKELVEGYNGKLHFIYLPEFNRYKVPNSFKKNNNKQHIKNIVSDLGIEFIDIDEEVFKIEKNPLKLFPFESYGHYNVDGYKKVALKIYEKTK
jgi:hypothetical protein